MQRTKTYRTWFATSLLLLLLALLFTLLLMRGLLAYPMLRVEQWLLLRPITAMDCMFREWVNVFQISFFLIITLMVGIVCILLGYRRRVLLYLFLLLCLGVGIEMLAKHLFVQEVPQQVSYGLFSLHCPQLEHQSSAVRWSVAVAMWWKIPPMTYWDKKMLALGAIAPLLLGKHVVRDYSYPSGHALRSIFLGMLIFWLCHRHVRSRWLRLVLMGISCVFAVSGGLLQFYIGNHLITDVLGGDLFGLSIACCAIGLLQRQYRRDVPPLQEASGMPYNKLVKTPS